MNSSDENLIILFFDVIKQSRHYASHYGDKNSNFFLGQYRCIHTLYTYGEMTQRALSDRLNIRATSLSELLAKLENKGYIKRISSEMDKRTFLVTLTDAGCKLAEKHNQERKELYAEILRPLSETEKDQFEIILGKIKEHYSELEANINE